MIHAVFAGSFDPFTLGHLDIVKRGLKLCDQLDVVVSVNSTKTGWLTPSERVDLILKATEGLKNIRVVSHQGLVVDYAKSVNARMLIRGVRSAADSEQELMLAAMNRSLNPSIETILIPAISDYSFVSSSFVRDLIRSGASASAYLPPIVTQYLSEKTN